MLRNQKCKVKMFDFKKFDSMVINFDISLIVLDLSKVKNVEDHNFVMFELIGSCLTYKASIRDQNFIYLYKFLHYNKVISSKIN